MLTVLKQIYQRYRVQNAIAFIAVTLKYNFKLNITKKVWAIEGSLWVMNTASQDNYLEMAFIQLCTFW